MPSEVRLGLLGLGTVGGGVYRVLTEEADELAKRTGVSMRVVAVGVRDIEKERDMDISPNLLTTEVEKLVQSDEVDIVVEVMGGIEGTKDLLLTALRKGKSIVTANKDLIAEHAEELFQTARQHGCDVLYEASVGGGIPIVRPLKQCLAGNRLEQVMGIVNGTTNFILTRMSQSGAAFEDALQVAQDLGYAESDPTSDIEGHDAGRKMAILASLAFHTRVKYSDVETEGIRSITDRDIAYAHELGYEIKLVGFAREKDGKVFTRVHPALLPMAHPLASVNDVYNAIFVRGNPVGETMFLGKGAGQLPTASAVVGDIIEAVRNLSLNTRGQLLAPWYDEKAMGNPMDSMYRFYLRLTVMDRAGVIGGIAGLFGDYGVSIQQMMQKWGDGQQAEIVIVTHEVREGNLYDAVAALNDLEVVHFVNQKIRVVE